MLAAAGLLPALLSPQGKRGLGASAAGFSMRIRANKEAQPPIDFVDYGNSLGLGGVETSLPSNDSEAARGLRRKLESYNMRVILNGALRTESDLPAFEALVKAAKEADAYGLRLAMTGRRYEQFDSFETFKANFEHCQRMIALAEPILRKHQVRLAIENHKGWRAAEQAAWMKRLGSEWVGVHFDFGNNLAFCEDPMETLRTLQPYILSCHIKDMAVEKYKEGFVLSEVPLGDGFLDLKQMVVVLRQKNADMAFDLEIITRDPLQIPGVHG
jgi:sugar phosphate isomerase/epimerase